MASGRSKNTTKMPGVPRSETGFRRGRGLDFAAGAFHLCLNTNDPRYDRNRASGAGPGSDIHGSGSSLNIVRLPGVVRPREA